MTSPSHKVKIEWRWNLKEYREYSRLCDMMAATVPRHRKKEDIDRLNELGVFYDGINNREIVCSAYASALDDIRLLVGALDAENKLNCFGNCYRQLNGVIDHKETCTASREALKSITEKYPEIKEKT